MGDHSDQLIDINTKFPDIYKNGINKDIGDTNFIRFAQIYSKSTSNTVYNFTRLISYKPLLLKNIAPYKSINNVADNLIHTHQKEKFLTLEWGFHLNSKCYKIIISNTQMKLFLNKILNFYDLTLFEGSRYNDDQDSCSYDKSLSLDARINRLSTIGNF